MGAVRKATWHCDEPPRASCRLKKIVGSGAWGCQGITLSAPPAGARIRRGLRRFAARAGATPDDSYRAWHPPGAYGQGDVTQMIGPFGLSSSSSRLATMAAMMTTAATTATPMPTFAPVERLLPLIPFTSG